MHSWGGGLCPLKERRVRKLKTNLPTKTNVFIIVNNKEHEVRRCEASGTSGFMELRAPVGVSETFPANASHRIRVYKKNYLKTAQDGYYSHGQLLMKKKRCMCVKIYKLGFGGAATTYWVSIMILVPNAWCRFLQFFLS